MNKRKITDQAVLDAGFQDFDAIHIAPDLTESAETLLSNRPRSVVVDSELKASTFELRRDGRSL